MDDMLMAKEAPPGWTNLAVGEPGILQGLFMAAFAQQAWKALDSAQGYPKVAGHGNLREELKFFSNQDNPFPGQHVVVATGAKQALLAAYYAYRMVKGYDAIYHPVPRWPSHYTLAGIAGYIKFYGSHPDTIARGVKASTLVVNTSPNNPDGVISNAECDVWDAAYAHRIYGFKWPQDIPKHETAVFSAAKLFGLSGDRIGWLVTKDPEIARVAAEYIEATTSGVAGIVQRRLLSLMKTIRQSPDRTRAIYNDVQSIFNSHHERLARAIGREPDGMGMFAWFKTTPRLDLCLTEAKIMTLPGSACGQPGYRRINLGGNPWEFEEAMYRLEREVKAREGHGDI